MLIDVRFKGDDGRMHTETWEFTRREPIKGLRRDEDVAYFIDAVMLRDGKRVPNTDKYFPVSPDSRMTMDTFLDCFVRVNYGKIAKTTMQYDV